MLRPLYPWYVLYMISEGPPESTCTWRRKETILETAGKRTLLNNSINNNDNDDNNKKYIWDDKRRVVPVMMHEAVEVITSFVFTPPNISNKSERRILV
jgi:hypothetical protein